MPAVLLVRHGQASWQSDDYDVLSDLGREQGRVVGRELERRALRNPFVFSGALNRQRDTATEAGLPAEVDPRWDEYDHVKIVADHGDQTGFDGSPRSVQALLDAALTAWIAAADPDGWLAFRDRTRAALQDLAATLPSGRDAVVFTSGGVIAALAAGILGTPGALVPLNRTAVNAGITTLTLGRGGVSLLTYNEHAHLPAPLVTYR